MSRHSLHPVFPILLLLSAAWGVLAASSDSTCITPCSDYSVVLGHCREQYWVNRECFCAAGQSLKLAAEGNETTADSFLGCMCNGEENDKVLGYDAIMNSVGICESCSSTPPRIQEDLSVRSCPLALLEGSAARDIST